MEELDLSKLNAEEVEELDRLLLKASEGGRLSAPALAGPGERTWGEAPKPNPATVVELLSPVDWIEKQINTLEKVGRDNYLIGVTHPKRDPIKAGIAAQKKYEAKMADKAVLARRGTELAKTNIDEWVAMAEKLGADRLVDGVKERRFKVERFLGRWHPLLLAHVRRIRALPDTTDADREKRMIENRKGLLALKGQT